MIKRLLLTSTLLASSALAIQAQDLFLSEGQYYTDESQTTPYTGRYTEFYDDGMLKMELFLKDGRPEGTYVIYYPDGKIAEVRSYYHGIFHGEWRTYNEAGQLTGIASYKEGQKDLILRSAIFFMPFICSLYNNFANKGISYESGKCKGIVLPEKDRGGC